MRNVTHVDLSCRYCEDTVAAGFVKASHIQGCTLLANGAAGTSPLLFGVQLHLRGRDDWILQARTPEEAKGWKLALQAAAKSSRAEQGSSSRPPTTLVRVHAQGEAGYAPLSQSLAC